MIGMDSALEAYQATHRLPAGAAAEAMASMPKDATMTSTATLTLPASPSLEPLSHIWITRGPVPTATGLAHQLGWLSQAFAGDGISVNVLQDGPQELARHYQDHGLAALFREGGNVQALVARAQGAPSRLIGLTWIDEWQTILVRPGSGITQPSQLKGLRVALPAFQESRAASIVRAMSLQGIRGALSIAGLTLDDVQFVDVPARGAPTSENELWGGLDYLVRGSVDAMYVKGASAVEIARQAGAVVGIDLDQYPDRRTRVNHGTPRPITVHEDLLENHFDVVVKFLDQTLRAADWAAGNLPTVRKILESETHASAAGVAAAYRNDFHLSLHPDLSSERTELLRVQKDFLRLHGFLDQDFDIDDWIDPRPLAAALSLRTLS